MNEVSLVTIATGEGNFAPFRTVAPVNRPQDPLKALYSGEKLGRKPNFIAEYLDKSSVTVAYVPDDGGRWP